ncbi:MAG: DUF3426 domain-containing protein [Alphaproteobacteria bacterium]
MSALKGLYVVLAAGAALGAAACSGPSVPEQPASYGLYARNDDHLVRLDGGPAWEQETWPKRSDLSPHSALIAYDRSLANAVPDNAVVLQNVAWVRYQVTVGDQSDVKRVGEWAVSDLPEFRVELNYFPVPDNPEMIEMHPRQELAPGLYSLKLQRADSVLASRFGVEWNDIDRDQYNLAHCVDRYVADGSTTFRPCSGTTTTSGLQIDDVEAERIGGSSKPSLVVTGQLRNAAATPLPVPKLDATLKDANGQALNRQTFSLDREFLAPGATADFRVVIDRPPRGVSLVSIGVAPETTSIHAANQ